jgi:hypothetical protein
LVFRLETVTPLNAVPFSAVTLPEICCAKEGRLSSKKNKKNKLIKKLEHFLIIQVFGFNKGSNIKITILKNSIFWIFFLGKSCSKWQEISKASLKKKRDKALFKSNVCLKVREFS